MNIEDNKSRMVFRNEVNGKALYSISLSHKKQDGNWENGIMSCRFPKDADIKDKSKIMIKSAWIDFYIKDKITHTYLFVNKYEIVKDDVKASNNTTSEYDTENSDIQLTDEDLPF